MTTEALRLGDNSRYGVYLPISVVNAGPGLLTRVHGDPEAARVALNAALSAVDPRSVKQMNKMQEFAAGRVYPFEAAYWVATTVGILALALTLTGVYLGEGG